MKIKSSDEIANWLFVLVIQALNKNIWEIYKVKDLKDPDDRRAHLCGFLDGEENEYEIYVSARKSANPTKDDMAKTLLHEVLHSLFMKAREERILKLESLLWNSFSKPQKEMIRSYIPKRSATKKP